MYACRGLGAYMQGHVCLQWDTQLDYPLELKDVRWMSFTHKIFREVKFTFQTPLFFAQMQTQGLAVGFQLDYLLKLKGVRSTKDKGVTLIHFMAR